MINFTDCEKNKVVYGIYSKITNRLMPIFEETEEEALEDLKVYGGLGYLVLKIRYNQAKLIYDDYCVYFND